MTRKRRSLLLDRLIAPQEHVSLRRFSLQHFPRTESSADKQIVDRLLKAWDGSGLEAELYQEVPAFVGKFDRAWAKAFLQWIATHTDDDHPEARSIVRGVARMQGDQVLSEILALLDQKRADVRALGWLGIVNLSRDRDYGDDEARRKALRRVLDMTVGDDVLSVCDELRDDVRSSMPSAIGPEDADTISNQATPRQLELLGIRTRALERMRENASNVGLDRAVEVSPKTVRTVAIDKLMRVTDWELLSGRFAKRAPPDVSQARPVLPPAERDTVETLLQAWSNRVRNDQKATLTAALSATYIQQILNDLPDCLGFPASAETVALLLEGANAAGRSAFLDTFKTQFNACNAAKSPTAFPGERALGVTLKKAFVDAGATKPKAIALSRWILETPNAAALLPIVARSAREAVIDNDQNVLSVLYLICDANPANWDAVASALGVMGELNDVNSLTVAIQRVMHVLASLNDVPVDEPGNLVEQERTTRLKKTRAIDEALSTLRRWADLENAKGLVLESCDAGFKPTDSSLVATKLKAAVIALREERVRQLWNTDLVKVEKDLQVLVSLDPKNFNHQLDHATVLRRLARTAGLTVKQRREYLEKALRSYQQAKTLATNNFDKLLTSEYLTVVSRNLGLRKNARQESEAAVTISADSPEAWIHLGFQFSELRQFDRAVEACSRAIALSNQVGVRPNARNQPYYYRERAYAYRELGQFDLAIADLNKAIEMGVSTWSVGEYRAWIYLRRGRHREALSACTDAIEGPGDKAYSYLYRGFVKRCLGAHVDALDDFKKAIASGASESKSDAVRSAYIAIGRAEAALGRKDAARAAFGLAESYEVDGEQPDYTRRAEARIQLGKYVEAIKDCECAN